MLPKELRQLDCVSIWPYVSVCLSTRLSRRGFVLLAEPAVRDIADVDFIDEKESVPRGKNPA